MLGQFLGKKGGPCPTRWLLWFKNLQSTPNLMVVAVRQSWPEPTRCTSWVRFWGLDWVAHDPIYSTLLATKMKG